MVADISTVEFWRGKFGDEHADFWGYENPAQLDEYYFERYGIRRCELVIDILKWIPKHVSILEIGCSGGHNLEHLISLGYWNVKGYDINVKSVEKARSRGLDVDLMTDPLKIPESDNSFDLVFTNELLSHMDDQQIGKMVDEIKRVAHKYIWGQEYFSAKRTPRIYRNHPGKLWSDYFAMLFRPHDVRMRFLPYMHEPHTDCMYFISQ